MDNKLEVKVDVSKAKDPRPEELRDLCDLLFSGEESSIHSASLSKPTICDVYWYDKTKRK